MSAEHWVLVGGLHDTARADPYPRWPARTATAAHPGRCPTHPRHPGRPVGADAGRPGRPARRLPREPARPARGGTGSRSSSSTWCTGSPGPNAGPGRTPSRLPGPWSAHGPPDRSPLPGPEARTPRLLPLALVSGVLTAVPAGGRPRPGPPGPARHSAPAALLNLVGGILGRQGRPPT